MLGKYLEGSIGLYEPLTSLRALNSLLLGLEIIRFIDYVNERRGGPHRNWTERRRHVTERPSIQGFWHPDQWLGVYKRKDE